MAINFGVPTLTIGSLTGVITQSADLTPEVTDYNALDENGNTCDRTQRDARLVCSFEVLFPSTVAVPFPGTTIAITGYTLPTVSSTGAITGSLTLGGTSSVNFKVDSASVKFSNTAYTTMSLTVSRDLVNGLPAA